MKRRRWNDLKTIIFLQANNMNCKMIQDFKSN